MKISQQRTRVALYHPLRRTASLSVLAFIFTLFSLELTRAGASLAPLWFPTSLMMVACYRHPHKLWPSILLCCSLSTLLGVLLLSSVDDTTFTSVAINIIEAIVGALLMRKLLPNYNPLQNLQDWVRLAGSCALIPPLVGGALVLMLAGGLSILTLPVAQYPTIAPPSVEITASYPGADAKTVQDTVTQVIEQNMNGIDNLLYMSSTSDSTGTVQITVTFDSGTNADSAQVQVQNKLQLAMPLLPQEVQQQGVNVKKSSSSFLMVLGMISTDGSMTQDDIADYVGATIKDPVSRTRGVGDVQLFGAQYAMRIWMDPTKLNNYQLTPVDVIAAIKTQNAQVAAGQLGGTPPVKGQQLNASIIAQTRLTSTDDFG